MQMASSGTLEEWRKRRHVSALSQTQVAPMQRILAGLLVNQIFKLEQYGILRGLQVNQPLETEVPASIHRDEPIGGMAAQFWRGLVEILRSRRRLLVIVSMAVIFTAAAQPIIDPDFWWHLRTGQYILETKSIPYTDIFSTVRFGSEWVTHEWLSEVFMYSIFRLLGYGGLIVAFSIIVTAAFWITYQQCRKRAGHPYVAAFAVLLGAAATLPTWGVRPQMFSLLFASIFISLLDRYCRREVMPSIWWLVPLFILWVNMHAGFALGLVLIVLTIAGLFLDWFLLRKDTLANVWRLTRPLGWVDDCHRCSSLS